MNAFHFGFRVNAKAYFYQWQGNVYAVVWFGEGGGGGAGTGVHFLSYDGIFIFFSDTI